MDWGKPQKIIASIVGGISIIGTVLLIYNWVTPISKHEALATEVRQDYAKVVDLIAANKNIQQTNYQFWIFQTKKDLDKLYEDLRKESDPIKKQQIQDQIDDKKQDLKNYKKDLNELK